MYPALTAGLQAGWRVPGIKRALSPVPAPVGRQRAGVLALARKGVRAQGLTLLCGWQQRRAKCHLSLFSAAKLSEQIPGVVPAASLSYLTPPGTLIIFKRKNAKYYLIKTKSQHRAQGGAPQQQQQKQ